MLDNNGRGLLAKVCRKPASASIKCWTLFDPVQEGLSAVRAACRMVIAADVQQLRASFAL